MRKLGRDFLFLIVIGLFVLPACERDTSNLGEIEAYNGPWLSSYNITTRYSDSALVRVIVEADTQWQFESGDAEYPDGLFLTFYDREGGKTNTLRADRGYFLKKDNLYRAQDDVVINNMEKKQILSTELLYWLPNEKRIFTDAFVTIETEDEILRGHGLEAPEDFSTYRILRTTGTFSVKDQQQ
jgi:LPS export ABC transporter protein LptC